MKFFLSENASNSEVAAAVGNSVTQGGGGAAAAATKPILFEKSATYFDNDLVPRRAHALLPRTKIVIF